MIDTKPTLPAYFAVTGAYFAFMLTDGALRMLVLLHFHSLGFSAVQLAYLFLLYEFAGVVTNLSAGWIAARYGLGSTLKAGLFLQILALMGLTQLDAGWGLWLSVVYAMGVQGLSGIAKDLTKMSAKSAVKVLVPDEESTLFKWVAAVTGAKNSIKGLGFFVGAMFLAFVGFQASLLGMAALLAIVLLAIVLRMPKGLPRGLKGAKFKEVLSTSPQVNWLSSARVFLFGARDVWFVVGIPVYFLSVLSDGSEAGNKAAFFTIGGFMAVWTILYGVVQIRAPKILNAQSKSSAKLVSNAGQWVASLIAIPAILAFAVYIVPPESVGLTVSLILGLLVFGAIFAVNSSLHSFLILTFTSGQRVTMDVGFYYMANAAGRLIGTLLSGVSYQIGGLPLCLMTASAMLTLSWLSTRKLIARA